MILFRECILHSTVERDFDLFWTLWSIPISHKWRRKHTYTYIYLNVTFGKLDQHTNYSFFEVVLYTNKEQYPIVSYQIG